tara:strand:+ start:261 stop:911 length:651 start_codon:yes stop_codon:yes gene_type:complete
MTNSHFNSTKLKEIHIMTLPITNYHLINDNNARAIYGAYHPKDWHAVESYLMSNPDWNQRLFDEDGGDWREAIAASRQLNIVLNHNGQKYQEIVVASSLVIEAYKTPHNLDVLQQHLLKNAFELALFKTLVMPDEEDAQVIQAYCSWKAKEVMNFVGRDSVQPMQDCFFSYLLDGSSDACSASEYWSGLCEPYLDPKELNPDYVEPKIVINFDDFS